MGRLILSLIMSTFLIRPATFQLRSYPVVLMRLGGSHSRRNPHLKLWKYWESNPWHNQESDMLPPRLTRWCNYGGKNTLVCTFTFICAANMWGNFLTVYWWDCPIFSFLFSWYLYFCTCPFCMVYFYISYLYLMLISSRRVHFVRVW